MTAIWPGGAGVLIEEHSLGLFIYTQKHARM
jgi:hypothetical protein